MLIEDVEKGKLSAWVRITNLTQRIAKLTRILKRFSCPWVCSEFAYVSVHSFVE